jgi:hypothetical protein
LSGSGFGEAGSGASQERGEGEFGLWSWGGDVGGSFIGVSGIAVLETAPDAWDLVLSSAVDFEPGPFEVERFARIAQGQPLLDGVFGRPVLALLT